MLAGIDLTQKKGSVLMWILQLIAACILFGVVVNVLEVSYRLAQNQPMTYTSLSSQITKITTPTVDIDEQGNIVRITDASGRVVFEESGA